MPVPYPTRHKEAEGRRKSDQAHLEPKGQPRVLDRHAASEAPSKQLGAFAKGLPARRIDQTKRGSVGSAMEQTRKASLKAPNKPGGKR